MILGLIIALVLGFAASDAQGQEMTLSAQGGKIVTTGDESDVLHLEGEVRFAFNQTTLECPEALIEIEKTALQESESLGLESLRRGEFMRGVTLIIDENRFTSDSAEALFQEGRFDLLGDVEGAWDEFRFFSQHARYDRPAEEIIASGDVRLQFLGHGIGFLDPGEETEQPLDVRCSRLVYSRAKSTVSFQGARRRQASIISGNLTISADGFVLHVDRENRRLLRLDGEGNVKIEAPTCSASSRRVSLDPEKETIVLRERVHCVSGGIFEQHVEMAEIVRVGQEYILRTFAEEDGDENDAPGEASAADGEQGSADGT